MGPSGTWGIIKVFNVSQSAGQFCPVREEGDGTQDNLSNDETDKDQVDLLVMKQPD